MKVNISQLEPGCITSNDINSLTNKPIIPENTVLTKQLIEVLHAFLIKSVEVEPFLRSGAPFMPIGVEEVNVEKKETDTKSVSFLEQYLNSVNDYKKLFQNWQSGLPVEIGKVRSIIVPLLVYFEEVPNELFTLHQYSTKEDYLFHHSVAVGVMAGYFGKKLHYNLGDCIQLAMAGILCDCGMSKIESSIIFKNKSLTYTEYNEIKKHPVHSYKMIEKISLLKQNTKLAILQHHERIDGSGYYLGISGDQLTPFGKIVAITDVYHAMCCETNYRQHKSPFVVIEEMSQGSFGKFDVQFLQLLIQEVVKVSIGTTVKLSDGQTGQVVFIDEKFPTRPMVKVSETEIIQLTNRRELYIAELIKED